MKIVSLAQNVPGPVAVSRLVGEGATATKIEPPWGDPLATYCRSWYEDLHVSVHFERLDLKQSGDRDRLLTLLDSADILLTSHRPSALQRLSLDAPSLRPRFPALRHVNIVGDTSLPEVAGHDLTYQAQAGLLQATMPLTLTADMLGAERAVAAMHAVMLEPGAVRTVGLYDALRDLAAPLRYGLTGSGQLLGGANPAYRLYSASEGTIAVAALEPHFRSRLYEGLGLPDGSDPSAVFLTKTATEWESWATVLDIPLVKVLNLD